MDFPIPSYDRENFNFTRDAVGFWSDKGDDPVAMVYTPAGNHDADGVQTLHFSHFFRRAQQVARGLKRLGVKKGDVLVLMSSKTPEWYELFCGCIYAGVVVCLCSTALTTSELRARVNRVKASAFAGSHEQAQRFHEGQVKLQVPAVNVIDLGLESGSTRQFTSFQSLLQPSKPPYSAECDTKSSEACILYFTSGTTGDAKVVQHTHISYPYAHALSGEHWLELEPGRILWNTSDQAWAKATWALFGAWTQGGALFLDGDEGPFDPIRVAAILHQYPITTFCASPAVYRQLTSEGSKELFATKRPKCLEHCLSAGESIGVPTTLKWYEITEGLMIADGYGQTETSTLCGNYGAIQRKLGSIGKPLPGVPLYVLDDEGQIAAPYQEGDIAVMVDCGDKPFAGLFAGYLQEDSTVQDPFIRDQSGNRWYLTGDRAHYDDEGYFWFKGRGDDVIISSGFRIGPAEVESVLQTHPMVVESAVVAAPDAKRGSIIKAFIVLHEDQRGLSNAQLMQDIQEHCLRQKSVNYCPQKIQFVPSGFLPKTISGKIIRKQLRMLET